MSKKKLKIWCYDTESDHKYLLYEETLDPEYGSSDRIVDAKTYAENGIDVLYFTDNYNEPRKLRCQIDTFDIEGDLRIVGLDNYDLSLTRQGGLGNIRLDYSDVVSEGGSLLSGTYQFAYRQVDPITKKVSKWSSLTNPIHVYAQENPSYRVYNSGYGLVTNRKIKVYAEPTLEELFAFQNGYIQFAVVENIFPDAKGALYASLLPMQESAVLEYKSNYKVATIPIEDIVVDYAAIDTAKTLTILRNRMFLGNIKYHDLEFDGDPLVNGGKPYVSTGFVKKKEFNPDDSNYTLEKHASMYKGYFRDEVYRFGVVYLDKYGNRSQVHVLDMTNVTDNMIASGTDMKFPSRQDSGYALLTTTSLFRWLGLNITLTNHPSWATAFEIVREDRIKRILFQSPSIPMATVKGIGALETYPSTGVVDGSSQTYTDAQPQTSDTILVPKNLLFPELKNIVKNNDSGGYDLNLKIKGEARYERGYNYSHVCVFPQENLYEGKGYEYKGYEKIETVDCVFVKIDRRMYEERNDSSLMEAAYTFYGTSFDKYFYNDSGWSSNVYVEESSSTQAAVYLDNYSSGDTIAGTKLESYSDLQTFGVPLGYKPNVQRKVVFKMNGSFTDEGSVGITFPIGTHNSYSAGDPIYNAVATPAYTDVTYNSFNIQLGTVTTPVQVIRIVNVVNENVGDDRYGSTDSQRKFISTGAFYSFEDYEISDIKRGVDVPISIDVFGGDCFVTSHTFKVCDSVYLLTNSGKFSGLLSGKNDATVSDNFDVAFKLASSSACLNIPVAVKGIAQFVQVLIESEYNGQAMDTDVLYPYISDGLVNIMNLESTDAAKASVKTCLTYNVNANLKFNNDPKVYFPRLTTSFNQNEFQSRIQYSDIKIYNSSETGFDIFRVANFYDMEESGGAITKLALASDNMYAIQTRRISYLPAGERIIEAADNGILAVGTGSVISQVSIIDERRGSQHLGGIVETGTHIMIPDNNNQAVYMLMGQQLMIVSDKDTASLFREKLGIVFDENNIRGVWDPIRKEYWLVAKDQSYFCYIYNMSIEQWVSNYEFSASGILYGGAFTNHKLWVLGKESGDVNVYTMYTGEHTNLIGTEVTPRITFVVNPDADFAKTFDDLAIAATERLQDVDFVVEREQSMGQQLVSEVNLDVFPVEGNYRIKTLRDPRDERLRGLRMKTTVRWMSNNIPSLVSSIYTKYRLSSRTPF